MMRTFTTTASAIALVGTMLTGLSAASAAALPVNSAKLADGQLIQARFVHRGRGFFPGAVVGGLAAGIIGSAIADGAYGYYGPYPYGYYGYGPYPYGGPYWGPYPYRW
jgi:hypothetical protein